MEYQYKCTFPRLGKAIIYACSSFDERLNLPARSCTDADVQEACTTLSHLGYDVEIPKYNMKKKELFIHARNASLESFEKDASIIIMFLTYATDSVIYCYEDSLEIETLTRMFKGDTCPSLNGKPKIFFITSSGPRVMEGEVLTDAASLRSKSGGPVVPTLPTEADVLIMFGSMPGFVAFGNSRGSWFVRSLCAALRGWGEARERLDLLRVLTRVCGDVAEHVSRSKKQDVHGKKQMPLILTTLTKEFYLP